MEEVAVCLYRRVKGNVNSARCYSSVSATSSCQSGGVVLPQDGLGVPLLVIVVRHLSLQGGKGRHASPGSEVQIPTNLMSKP